MELAPPADGLRVGVDLAITPGEVVYRNELMARRDGRTGTQHCLI
jgi:hypothetical protein